MNKLLHILILGIAGCIFQAGYAMSTTKRCTCRHLQVFSVNNLTPNYLWAAAVKNHPRCIRTLLQNNANINQQGPQGETALIAAADRGHYASLKLLLEAGADVNLQDENGRTALLRCCGNGQRDTLSCVRLLLKYGADSTLADKDGITVLMRGASAYYNSIEYMNLFLHEGVAINAESSNGDTALVRALRGSNTQAAWILWRAGAKITQRARDEAALFARSRTEEELPQELFEDVATVE